MEKSIYWFEKSSRTGKTKNLRSLLIAWERFKIDFIHEDYLSEEKAFLMDKFIEKAIELGKIT